MLKKDGGKTSPRGGVDTAQGAQKAPGGRKASAGPSARKNGKATPQAENLPPDYVFGRPTDYRLEYVRIASAMSKLGGTDFEIAEELGTTTVALWRWRSKYKDFRNAIEQGKAAFDDRAERSLAQKAMGYTYHTEKLFLHEGQVIRAETVEHCPPDVGALRFWLMNRRPDQWRDKKEVKMDGTDAFLKIWQAISEGKIGEAA